MRSGAVPPCSARMTGSTRRRRVPSRFWHPRNSRSSRRRCAARSSATDTTPPSMKSPAPSNPRRCAIRCTSSTTAVIRPSAMTDGTRSLRCRRSRPAKKSVWTTGPTASPSITSLPAPAAPEAVAARCGMTTGKAWCAPACDFRDLCARRWTASSGARLDALLLPRLRRTGAAMPRVLLGAIGAGLALATCAAFAAPRFSDFPGKAASSVEVDVELVMAVDISYSMDMDELALQREGYAQAIASQEFLNALKQGTNGKVAVTLVEWAGVSDQRVVVPWRLIDGPASAQAVSEEMTRAPVRRAFRTSISGALMFAATLFENNGYRGIRRVIDVSGDGTNNQGPIVTQVRDDVIAKGIIINGLPIMLKEPQPNSIDIKDLAIYS